MPFRELAKEMLAFVDDVVDELGSRQEVERINWILDNGTGADRQLRVYEQTGDFKKVVDYICEETSHGLDEGAGRAALPPRADAGLKQHMQHLTELPFVYSEDLVPGARNAVRTCLQIQPGERVTIVTDMETEEIGASLAGEARHAGALIDVHVMEDYGPRPMLELPREIAQSLEGADVSIYAGQPKTGDSHSAALTKIVDRRQIRHARGLDPRQIMCEAMRADPTRWTRSPGAFATARKGREDRRSFPPGSYIEATFDPRIKWLKTSGIISTAKWGNLPGARADAPARVDGVHVADGVVGEYLAPDTGTRGTPLSVTIENSRIAEILRRPGPRQRFPAHVHGRELNRVGEFAIGTNTAISQVIGNILQDEKPRPAHRLRPPLHRAHRRGLVLDDPYRHRRPPLRHLVRRRPGDGGRPVLI